jgi:hypothetical protein
MENMESVYRPATIALMSAIDIYMQIDCIKRELAMRRRLYPKLIGSERMSVTMAEAELKTMAAVLQTLEEIAAPRLLLP